MGFVFVRIVYRETSTFGDKEPKGVEMRVKDVYICNVSISKTGECF